MTSLAFNVQTGVTNSTEWGGIGFSFSNQKFTPVLVGFLENSITMTLKRRRNQLY
ncbi:hypothetical protein RO3G_10214 [Rhizopus delemar RA 99-880]|uniref:Uncharacterized protein n=1 Tax=Rhizopus delemar (strain RA 99-880 / ATCC MYA-4621 / FGSC 9543 / NRRL 43880) TaxID=246409 RepID=I1CAM4_RHIO9|nr:hypothetical protein RO3G_10214 [Rhizopus delemar RA 99-880]|eukprot:EIE85504.1 hypothetical protein RO3G_10214 [Rhizopus delemar RA 99-880]